MAASITLAEFIDGLYGLPRQGNVWAEGVRLMLDAHGPLNAHLAFPTDPSQRSRNGYDRASPLSLDMPVYGDFLVLTYYGHDPSLILTEHASLDEMKCCILNAAGSLNIWTSAQFAFHQLRPLPFTIRYTDRNSVAKHFHIEHPEIVQEDWDMKTPIYVDVELAWNAK